MLDCKHWMSLLLAAQGGIAHRGQNLIFMIALFLLELFAPDGLQGNNAP